MAATDDVTMEGIFPDRTLADKAAGELIQSGFRAEQIETIAFDGVRNQQPETPPSLLARGGAVLGGLLGACLGALVGIWFGPGFNRALHDFALADFLATLAGIVILGVLGALVGWAIEGRYRDFYSRDLHPGKFAVKVRGPGNLAQALEIMRQNGGDVFERRVAETTLQDRTRNAFTSNQPTRVP